MKHISVIILIILSASLAHAEFVFLKDGKILQGKIISDAADDIMFRSSNGQNMKIERKNILRTLYTNLSMSKLYIQKRNGESFMAYPVYEDRDEYWFRNDLYKPEEYKVSRKDILFMSEKNPSALKGEPASDEIKLSWLPPYGQVKIYRIYMKEKKEDSYRVIGSTKKTEITITGLKTQTPYIFIVRAIDDTDYESNPSNEIQVITKSRLPERPVVKAEKDQKENWVLVWTETSDSDGKVEGYRIYVEKKGEYALLEETKKLKAIVPADAIFDSIHVRSVDNNGDESEADNYRNEWRFLLSPQLAFPTGKMADFTGNGYGANIDISRRDLLFNDFESGITAGYLKVDGKKKIGDGNSDIDSFNIVPAALFAAYRIPYMFDKFNHYDIISFFPKLSAGIMTIMTDYKLYDNKGFVDRKKSSVVFEPFIKAGIFAEYGISRNFFLTFGGEFTYMIDSIKGLGMINIPLSAGYRF